MLAALLDLGFDVTVLARNAKPYPGAARVEVVDFTSVESLSAVLAEKDAVIDTTFSPEVETPLRLIDAAAQAGVDRLSVIRSHQLDQPVFVELMPFFKLVSPATSDSILICRAFVICLSSAERRLLMTP